MSIYRGCYDTPVSKIGSRKLRSELLHSSNSLVKTFKLVSLLNTPIHAKIMEMSPTLILRRPTKAAQKTSFGVLNAVDAVDVSVFSEGDWTVIETAVSHVSSTDEEREGWLRDIRKGLPAAVIALELVLLPNLESLDLTVPFYDEHEIRWVNRLMGKAAASQRGPDKAAFLLPNLRSLSLGWYDTEGGMDIEHVVDFISVPSVQRLEAFMVSSEGWEASPGKLFSLKELKLSMSSIDSEALKNLLLCCPHLEILSYQSGGATVGFSVLVPSVLSPALATLKPCLQELEIMNDEDMDCDLGDGDPEMPIASFADFEKLHTLSLRACMLIGKEFDKDEQDGESEVMELDSEDVSPRTARLVDVVPKSLKKLSLNKCGAGILEHLAELLERKEDVTPVLERIDIVANAPIGVDEFKRLVDKFGERNVALEMQ